MRRPLVEDDIVVSFSQYAQGRMLQSEVATLSVHGEKTVFEGNGFFLVLLICSSRLWLGSARRGNALVPPPPK